MMELTDSANLSNMSRSDVYHLWGSLMEQFAGFVTSTVSGSLHTVARAVFENANQIMSHRL